MKPFQNLLRPSDRPKVIRRLAIGRLMTLACIAVACWSGQAAAFGPCCCFCDQGQCKLNVDRGEAEVPVFRVECEAICIPPLRFPWECGPIRKCGKVRHVKKLVIEARNVPVCLYEWEAIHCCGNCRERLRHHHRRCLAEGGSAFEESEGSGEPATPMQTSAPPLALVTALLQQEPDEQGWVHVTNRAAEPLGEADNGLVDEHPDAARH